MRTQERVPAEAVSMAVSLDGVMVPMKNGGRQAKRAQAAEEGKYTRGPAGNKEVGCGTLSFYDEEGERLATIRMARMPEVKKATLKVTLSKEVNSCLAERPDLKVVKVADGAKDNWTFLSGELPDGEEVIDFYHAAGTSTRLWRLPMATPIRSAVPSSRNCDTCFWKTTREWRK